jgi:hypothetical protein
MKFSPLLPVTLIVMWPSSFACCKWFLRIAINRDTALHTYPRLRTGLSKSCDTQQTSHVHSCEGLISEPLDWTAYLSLIVLPTRNTTFKYQATNKYTI